VSLLASERTEIGARLEAAGSVAALIGQLG
jgi:hypothetical protein